MWASPPLWQKVLNEGPSSTLSLEFLIILDGDGNVNSEESQVISSGKRRLKLVSEEEMPARPPALTSAPSRPPGAPEAGRVNPAQLRGRGKGKPCPQPRRAQPSAPARPAPGDSGTRKAALSQGSVNAQGKAASEGTCTLSPSGGQQWNNGAWGRGFGG